MIVSITELQQFSGVIKDENDTLSPIYIGTATEIINAYLGYDCEKASRFIINDELVLPSSIKLVCLEIATLIQLEESQNLGVNSKSFNDSGSRTFLNQVDYSKYLSRISVYRSVTSSIGD